MWETNLEGNDIAAIYSVFSGRSAKEDYPYVVMAAASVESRLVETADPADKRLIFLAAALANLYSLQAQMTREPESNSLLGLKSETTSSKGSADRLEAARSMVNAFTAICSPLLKDSAFCFERTNAI